MFALYTHTNLHSARARWEENSPPRAPAPLRPDRTACSQKANQVIGWVAGWDSSGSSDTM